MITLDNRTLRNVQLTELEMLQEVDRICRKNNIRYVIIAGTLLGAVRHGGFIPWDDDADIGMLREEYEKFRLACERDLDHERFYFQDHRNTPGYRWGYGKLRRKDTLFLREHQEHMPYEQGVFIDIFPLDQVPENRVLRTLKNFECFCVRKILWSEVGKIADRNTVKRTVYGLLSRVPEESVLHYYDRMVRRAGKRDSSMVRILLFPTPNRQYMYLKKWYAEPAETVFEGYAFAGIAAYDEYLSFKYGDYMTLPPEGKRKTHPVSAIRVIDWMKE